MAIHNTLPIHKEAYDLLGHVIKVARNLPRDLKKLVGDRLIEGCLKVADLIRQANIAVKAAKVPPLDAALALLDEMQLLLRRSRDDRYITTPAYAKAIEHTTSIARQATAWRNRFKPAT